MEVNVLTSGDKIHTGEHYLSVGTVSASQYCSGKHNPLGTVVQRWVNANPGLKFNLLFWFVYFCTSVYFKTSENKTPTDPGKISEKNIFKFIDKLSGSLL